jgi:hypothetical protein
MRVAAGGEQNRSGASVADGLVDGAPDRRRQRHQDDLVALAVHPEYPVAVFLAEVCDVGAGGLTDP